MGNLSAWMSENPAYMTPYYQPRYLEPSESSTSLASLLPLLVKTGQKQKHGSAPRARAGGGPAPKSLTGIELFYGGNSFNPSSADPSHQSHLHWGAERGNILPELRNLERKGFDIGENKHFGDRSVSPVHVNDSLHYRNKRGQVRSDYQGRQAGDITYSGGGRWKTEGRALNWLEHYLARKYGT